MTILIRHLGRTRLDRAELVSVLSALDEDEFSALVEDARGPALVPLVELALEGLAQDANDLAKRIERIDASGVVVDDIGRRCCTRKTARRLFDDREEQRAMQRARARRQNAENAERRAQHREEFARKQAYQRETGHAIPPPDWEPTAVMPRRS